MHAGAIAREQRFTLHGLKHRGSGFATEMRRKFACLDLLIPIDFARYAQNRFVASALLFSERTTAGSEPHDVHARDRARRSGGAEAARNFIENFIEAVFS
jgi:hypothetical protein